MCGLAGTGSHAAPPPVRGVLSLPSELVQQIFAQLSPADLAAVSQTCHALYVLATADNLWQALVQANVPGQTLASPFPCASFRELYAAHDPRWFLTRYKIWFSGMDLTGKLILVRYDAATGCIEGCQLVAISHMTLMEHWEADNDIIIQTFNPEVILHSDLPVLRLDAVSPRELSLARKAAEGAAPPISQRRSGRRFKAEIPMALPEGVPHSILSNFIFEAATGPEAAGARNMRGFPYGNIWPPPTVPARDRVKTSNLQGNGLNEGYHERQVLRSQVSDRIFRIRKWLDWRRHFALSKSNPLDRFSSTPEGLVPLAGPDEADDSPSYDAPDGRPAPPTNMANHGNEIWTYATLDPALYTPTADKPWRGIWVGDYSEHGCEFLLIHQPDDDDDDDEPLDDATLERREGETPAEFEKRTRDARIYRGRLEAIKLTGDPNVPRGEYTFIAEDLGEKGLVTVVQEEPFVGTRVVRSKGHVAEIGFIRGRRCFAPHHHHTGVVQPLD